MSCLSSTLTAATLPLGLSAMMTTLFTEWEPFRTHPLTIVPDWGDFPTSLARVTPQLQKAYARCARGYLILSVPARCGEVIDLPRSARCKDSRWRAPPSGGRCAPGLYSPPICLAYQTLVVVRLLCESMRKPCPICQALTCPLVPLLSWKTGPFSAPSCPPCPGFQEGILYVLDPAGPGLGGPAPVPNTLVRVSGIPWVNLKQG